MAYAPHPFMVLPFIALLALIAAGPVLFPNWWLRHYPKVALGLGAITLSYYLFALPSGARQTAMHTGAEYVSFIALIGSLYVVSGGIHIMVKGEATPRANVLFLLIGAVIANIFGTTGASMLLIHPWLRMNKYRITGHHVVFFIFIVSNVGGCLTTIGDPPLFLGYLKGVPFFWVIKHCWPMWLAGNGILLLIFYLVDRRNYLKAPPAVRAELAEPADTWRFEGMPNLFFLGMILLSLFIRQPPFLREAIMLVAAMASWYCTHEHIHKANQFNFHPLQEVAILFIGIFATMMPALDWLRAHAHEFGAPTAGVYYWGTGILSAVLDNAPTYLSFLSAAFGTSEMPSVVADPRLNHYLLAISIGAVFFGAATYIGNGPNFMVKAIADSQKIRTPTFVGYIFKYTLPFLLPMLILIWLIFFR